MIKRNLFFLILILTSSSVLALPDAKITVKVVDESGQPIEGAKVVIGFRKPRGETFGGIIGMAQSDLTDGNGLFTAQGATEPFVGIGVSKEGYYRSSTEYNFNYKQSGMPGFRKWQPWNPTIELVLKEIKKPIALYSVSQGVNNDHQLILPGVDQFYGYDLIARDWVVPYGMGTHKDFLFKLDVLHYESWKSYDAILTIKFSNPGDGLISVIDKPNDGSKLRLPHHAPVSNYQSELVQRISRTPMKIDRSFRNDQNYFFRVRTEMDDKGNITSALYGKIHGSIEFGIKKRNILFLYYLNPKPNDTNLEFDPKKNLFQGLSEDYMYGLTP